MSFFKKNKIISILSILFVVSSLTAYFFDRGILFWNPKETHLGFNLQNVTQKLHERSRKADFLIKKTYSLLGDTAINRESLTNIAEFLKEQDTEKEAFSLFIYENDTLKYWSSTQMDINKIFNDSIIKNRILLSGTGYYLQNHLTKLNINILCFSLIKREYPIENQYLSPRFYKELGIPKNVSIQTDKNALGIDIADIDGKFLLKLMPAYATFSQKPYFNTSIFFYVLSTLLFLLLIYFSANKISKINKFYSFLFLSVLLLLLRYLTIQYKFPANIYHFELFKPQYFSQSFWFGSLGDFLINALLLFYISYFAFSQVQFSKIRIKNFPIGKIILITFTLVNFEFNYQYINYLIQNSSINFVLYKILKFNMQSFLGYTIISLMLGTLWLWSEKLIKELGKIKSKENYFALIIGVLLGIILNLMTYKTNFVWAYLFLLIFIVTIYYFRHYYNKAIYFSYVILVILLSSYTVLLVQKDVIQKETEIEKVIAINLAAERDPIAELFFIEKQKNLESDTLLINILKQTNFNADELRKYLIDKYLKGYLSKYDLQVTICTPQDSFWIDDENREVRCYDYFNQIISFSGSRLRRSQFYFIDNLNGRISYLGWLKFNLGNKIPELSVLMELDSKLQTEETGYPELLLDKRVNRKSRYKDFNYAKYKYNTLITQHGAFPYDIRLKLQQPKDSEFSRFVKNGFHHIAYWLDKDNVIVVSRKENSLIDYLISFSYLFLAFYILTSVLVFAYKIYHKEYKIRFGLKWQIQFSMVAMLVITLLVVGSGTVYYIFDLYQKKHLESLNEKIQSINNELSHKLLYEPGLTKKWNSFEYRNLNELLMKFADVLYIDVHLYDAQGSLLATSRPEIFTNNLQSRQMNYQAYFALILQQRQKFFHKEHIGNLEYLSAYLPFRNVDNKILAYVNLPFFSKQSEITSEIYTLTVTVLNVFVLLILIATFIALFTSNQITQPLQLIQQNMRDIQLGKSNSPINYHKDDEIGQLVSQYNKMLSELQLSAELLAQSERESAWREMAKQIAHEIKNPLTPMKLSVQYIKRSWENGDDNFNNRFEGVTQTLIEQIDALSAIASAFSNFAKMPRSKMQIIDCKEILINSVTLYNSDDEIDIKFNDNGLDNLNVFVDKKELQRVFINLIKNGIQAVPEDRKPQIEIDLKKDKNNIIIRITDNGSGVPEELRDKLFRPNFTTKTAGMGLGLAITKNIIENEKGKIWFETELNKGTSFFVQLPLVED